MGVIQLHGGSMNNDNVTEITENSSESGKSKLMVYSALAVASVVGIMAFALAIRNKGETEAVDSTNNKQ
jgi:hypothetical protein